MKQNLFLLITIIFSICFNGYGQTEKKINKDQQTWLSLFHQTRVSDHWGAYFDASYRRSANFLDKPFQLALRPGIIYYVSDKVRLIGGYAYFSHYPGRTSRHIIQPEHRIWQQVQWNQKYQKFSTRQYIRFEQRFRRKFIDNDNLAEDYHFNYRLRYSFGVTVPLIGKEAEPKSLYLILNDEIFINFGKEIVHNYFDQNRASIQLGFQLSKELNLQLGYMRLFQQQSSGSTYNSNDVIRITLNYNLDLRQKEEN